MDSIYKNSSYVVGNLIAKISKLYADGEFINTLAAEKNILNN